MNFMLWAFLAVMEQHPGCRVQLYPEGDYLVAQHGEERYRIDQCDERTMAYVHGSCAATR